jgi:hypothetical protein
MIPSELLPTSPSGPAPFSPVKLPIRFESVDWCSGMFPNRLTTRSRESLDLTFQVQLRLLEFGLNLLELIVKVSDGSPRDLDSGLL